MEDRSYHHGNLREALIAPPAKQIEEIGFEALSLRDLAASLDVSRAAPYRHFADRRELLAAIAADGFKHLQSAALAAIAKNGCRLRAWPLERAHTLPSRRDALNCFG